MSIVTRFPPSPTGYLHIGSLRTVLYNYLFAKQNNGKMILRIEDTDRERFVEGSVENLIHILNEVGLEPDEGPNNPGEVGPYFQSERLDIYKKYIDKLVEDDKAYHCFCDSKRLTELREEQAKHNLPTKYDQKCRFLNDDEIKEKLDSNSKYTIRLKVPKSTDVEFNDITRGKVVINTKDIDDQILLKTDGFPTYHGAVVIDDHLMGVTHVIRGEEWVPSTPKHILLYNAFGWEIPIFCHMPLILGNDKKKLSKRTGDVAVEIYLQKGYLVEAIINYITLLGWNPKTTEEFFTLDELIDRFKLEHVNSSGAIFDVERLDFFNSNYIKKMDTDILYDKFVKYLKKYNPDFLKKISDFPEEYNKNILSELKTKIKKFEEFEELTTFFYSEPTKINKELYINEKMKIDSFDIVKKSLKLSIETIKNNKFNSVDDVKQAFIKDIKENEMKNGQVLWPTRVALSGESFSPGALELIYILGNEKSIQRIEKCLKEL